MILHVISSVKSPKTSKVQILVKNGVDLMSYQEKLKYTECKQLLYVSQYLWSNATVLR